MDWVTQFATHPVASREGRSGSVVFCCVQVRFRQDIQGLRAVAVLLVALDHAAFGPFHGGFVGVDVFLVISGYLITSLLLREADQTGEVSLGAFYARRARRILPAALLVTVATILLSVRFLDGSRALDVGEQAIWVTFFAANIKFASEQTDYFNQDSPLSPLQHYWSLSVEEQFYLVWPVILLIALALLSRRLGGPRRAAGAVLGGIVVVSFLWSVHRTATEPLAAYFSTPARAYELGLGGLAAVVAPALLRLRITFLAFLLALGSWVGIGLIAYAALSFDSGTPFPGSAALVPVVGTVLLLLGGLPRVARWGPQRILAVLPLRRLGDWSYSFYLWHWPLLVVAAHLYGPISGGQGLLVLSLALGLSAATFRWVETPFRARTSWDVSRWRALLLYPATVAVVLPAVLLAQHVVRSGSQDGGPAITLAQYGQGATGPSAGPRFSKDPYVALVEASVRAAENDVAMPGNLQPNPLDLGDSVFGLGECDYVEVDTDDLELCPRGAKDGDKALVLIGDSHARQWIPALERIARQDGYVAYYLVREGCPGVDQVPWPVDGPSNVACAAFQDWAVAQVEALRPEITLLASDANERGYGGKDGVRVYTDTDVEAMHEAGMLAQVERVSPVSGRTVVIGDPPLHEIPPGECLGVDEPTLRGCLSPPQARSELMTDATRRAAAQGGADFVRTRDWFCVDDTCPTVVGQMITHRDDEHITVEYAAYLTPALARALRIPYEE